MIGNQQICFPTPLFYQLHRALLYDQREQACLKSSSTTLSFATFPKALTCWRILNIATTHSSRSVTCRMLSSVNIDLLRRLPMPLAPKHTHEHGCRKKSQDPPEPNCEPVEACSVELTLVLDEYGFRVHSPAPPRSGMRLSSMGLARRAMPHVGSSGR